MPNPATIESRFKKANDAGDLSAAVQLARAVVIENIWTGRIEDDPGSLTALLLGDDYPRPATIDRDGHEYVCAQTFAALAMGIALGQLLHSDVFTKGGRS
jgi:hypothetical protein